MPNGQPAPMPVHAQQYAGYGVMPAPQVSSTCNLGCWVRDNMQSTCAAQPCYSLQLGASTARPCFGLTCMCAGLRHGVTAVLRSSGPPRLRLRAAAGRRVPGGAPPHSGHSPRASVPRRHDAQPQPRHAGPHHARWVWHHAGLLAKSVHARYSSALYGSASWIGLAFTPSALCRKVGGN